MTDQEILDKVAAHLFAQGKPAKRPGDDVICQFRGENDTKCAVGCLIPDELYRPEMDETMPLSLVLAEIGLKDHRGLLGDLQHVHDDGDSNWQSTAAMRAALTSVAEIYGLNPPSPELRFADR